MSSVQLNSLAAVYRTERTDDAFRKLYELASSMFEQFHRDSLFSKGCRDSHSAKESFDSAVFELSRREDVENFANALSAALRRKRLMICRSLARRRNRFPGSLDETEADESGEYAPKYRTPDEPSAEDVAIHDLCRKKEDDQRQLIDFLKHSGNPDATTIALVEAFLLAPPSASDTSIAESIGIHHQKAKRSLRKLSRQYDVNRFGDYSDYLAV